MALFPKATAIAVGLSIAAGCAPMQRIDGVDTTTSRATGVANPFTIQIDGEPIDVSFVPDGSTLALEQAIKLTFEHDPKIQSALAQVRQAQLDAKQSRLLPNPVLAVALRFPEGGGPVGVDLDLGADFLALLTKPGLISAADNRLRKASADALVTVLDVMVDLQKRYAAVQSLDARVQITSERRSLLSQLTTLTDARVAAGEAGRLDVLTVKGELSSLEAELLLLKSQQKQARLGLARRIGEPSGSANWPLEKWSDVSGPALPEADLVTLGLTNRPELDSIKWELAALGQEVKLARIATLTGGDIGASAERDDGNWSIGPAVSIPIPIFDTGAVAKERVLAQVSEQKHALTLQGRAVVEEIRVAFEQFQSSRAGLDRMERETIALQSERLEQAKEAYRLGLSDILSVRIAEQDLQEARAQRVELQAQLADARFDLDRAIGGRAHLAPGSAQATTSPSSATTKVSE
jgi:outer membrane protein TolC